MRADHRVSFWGNDRFRIRSAEWHPRQSLAAPGDLDPGQARLRASSCYIEHRIGAAITESSWRAAGPCGGPREPAPGKPDDRPKLRTTRSQRNVAAHGSRAGRAFETPFRTRRRPDAKLRPGD